MSTKGMAGAISTALGMVVCCVALTGCPGKSGEGDAGADSGEGTDSGNGCPSPAGACVPTPCNHGNANNVGAYCTAGGHQCDAYHNGLLGCAVDFDARGGNYCILVGCTTNAECGANACCTGDPAQSTIFACVPQLCLADAGDPCPPPPSLDAGTDGGTQDSGSPDSGTLADAGPKDGGTNDAGCVPSPPGTCQPTPCSTGDSHHVGAYCTPGGNQCLQYALGCADDLDMTTGEDFCISLFCANNAACGPYACCASGQSDGGGVKACVPIGCFGDGGTGVCTGP